MQTIKTYVDQTIGEDNAIEFAVGFNTGGYRAVTRKNENAHIYLSINPASIFDGMVRITMGRGKTITLVEKQRSSQKQLQKISDVIASNHVELVRLFVENKVDELLAKLSEIVKPVI